MKYKAGDKVKVRKWDDMVEENVIDYDGDIWLENGYFYSGMRGFCGDMVTISVCYGDGAYSIEEDNGEWLWTDNMFEKHRFKMGDIVKGKEGLSDVYRYTDSDSICEVVELRDNGVIEVKIIGHSEHPSRVGKTYPVEPQYFELIGDSVLESQTRFDIHKKICEELHETYVRKNTDYGNSFGETFEELGLISAVSRMIDKVNRLKTIAKGHDPLVEDESLEDTLLDLANYSIITLVEIQASKVKNESKQLIKKGDLVKIKPIDEFIDMLEDDYGYENIQVCMDMLKTCGCGVEVEEVDYSDSTFCDTGGYWYHFDMVDFVE